MVFQKFHKTTYNSPGVSRKNPPGHLTCLGPYDPIVLLSAPCTSSFSRSNSVRKGLSTRSSGQKYPGSHIHVIFTGSKSIPASQKNPAGQILQSAAFPAFNASLQVPWNRDRHRNEVFGNWVFNSNLTTRASGWIHFSNLKSV